MALALVPAWGVAGPTALNSMPVADVLGDREISFSLYSYGERFKIGERGTSWHATQIGLFDGIEFGYDNNFYGETVWNAKLQFAKTKWGAVSGGLLNWKSGSATPYVVGRVDFEKFRLHAGWLKDDYERALVGVDFELPWGMTGMIDWFSAPNSYVWAGVSFEVPKLRGVNLTVSAGVPTVSGDRTLHSITLGYNIRF